MHVLTGAPSVSIRGDNTRPVLLNISFGSCGPEFCGAQNDRLSETSTFLPAFASVQHDIRRRDVLGLTMTQKSTCVLHADDSWEPLIS